MPKRGDANLFFRDPERMGEAPGGVSDELRGVVNVQCVPVPCDRAGVKLDSVVVVARARVAAVDLEWRNGQRLVRIRELARPQGAWANILPKRNRKDPICFSPYLYRARNLIERFFKEIKQCRRVATRYDKLAANYLAFVKLASIRIWLRDNESTT